MECINAATPPQEIEANGAPGFRCRCGKSFGGSRRSFSAHDASPSTSRWHTVRKWTSEDKIEQISNRLRRYACGKDQQTQ